MFVKFHNFIIRTFKPKHQVQFLLMVLKYIFLPISLSSKII